MWRACINECACCRHYLKGISKNLPYPLLWRGIKAEVKTRTRIFRDALKRKPTVPTVGFLYLVSIHLSIEL